MFDLSALKLGIVGLSRTGISVWKFLNGPNVIKPKLVIIHDDAITSFSSIHTLTKSISKDDANLKETEDMHSMFTLLNDSQWNNLDYIIVSPGIPLNHPVFSLSPKKISDIELFYKLFHKSKHWPSRYNDQNISNLKLCNESSDAQQYKTQLPNLMFIAITGTNGKSTITTQIAQIIGVKPLGNIGTPILDGLCLNPNSNTFVVEISSNQTDLQDDFAPDILVISNITEDHLDRYKSFANYMQAKLSILNNMLEHQIAILNIDDPIMYSVVQGILSKHDEVKSNEPIGNTQLYQEALQPIIRDLRQRYKQNKFFLWPISLKNPSNGLERHLINITLEVCRQSVEANQDQMYMTPHYISNTLLSLCALYVWRVKSTNPKLAGQDIFASDNIMRDFESLALSLVGFKHLPFRNQLIAKIQKISFINDSKSTTPDSTAKAFEVATEAGCLQYSDLQLHANGLINSGVPDLDCLPQRKIFLLAGGIFKANNVDCIIPFKRCIHKVYLYGTSKALLFSLLRHDFECSVHDTLDNSFESALKDAQEYSNECIILLSPMCSSFDQFKSFEHRGERFNQLVAQIVARLDADKLNSK